MKKVGHFCILCSLVMLLVSACGQQPAGASPAPEPTVAPSTHAPTDPALAACGLAAPSMTGEPAEVQPPSGGDLDINTPDGVARRTPDEAAELIRNYLLNQKPDLDPAVPLSVEEIPLEQAWAHLRVQIFRVTEGPFANESYLIGGDIVLQLDTATGGQGLTSLEVGNLDQDEMAELYFTYSFGSGIHQSHIAMYAPAYDEARIFEAKAIYHGDLGLFKENISTIGVRVVEPDDATKTLSYGVTLGNLAIEQRDDRIKLVLQVAGDLPDDVLKDLSSY